MANKKEPEVIEAEIVSTAIVKKPDTDFVKDEWVWDKKKRVAFRMMLEGAGPLDIAKKIGVHRNTIRNWTRRPEWALELRNRVQEKQLSTKLRRLDLTESLADNLSLRAAQAINGEIPSHQLVGIYLKEYREYVKAERELYGENPGRGGGGGGQQAPTGGLVNINIGGQTPVLPEASSELDGMAFREFLRARVPEGATIEANSEQEALINKTRELLQQTDVLDQIYEADKKEDHDEAVKDEANRKRK